MRLKHIQLISSAILTSLISAGLIAVWLGGSDRFSSFSALILPTIAFSLVTAVVSLAWFLLRHANTPDRIKLDVRGMLEPKVRRVLFAAFLLTSVAFALFPTGQPITLQRVSSEITKAALSQVPKAQQAQLQRELGKEIDIQVRSWLEPAIPYLSPLLAVALFLGLMSFGFIFRFIGIWLAIGLFGILRRVGFVRIEEKDVKAEVVTL